MAAKKKAKIKAKWPPKPLSKAKQEKLLGFKPRPGGGKRMLKPYAETAPRPAPKIDVERIQGSAKLPPVSGKTGLKKGEEDYGQSAIDTKQPHITVRTLIAILKKCPNPDTTKVWMEGSQYWGQCAGIRLFEMNTMALLVKRN